MKLDTTDKMLLELLQKDAKQSVKALANQVNLSATAVYERIKNLERNLIIQHYTIALDAEKVEKEFLSFCMIQLDKHSQQNLIEFEKKIQDLDEVLECFHISGTYDYMLKIRVKNIAEYRSFMVDKLTDIPHIANTQSAFSINEVKSNTGIKLLT
ncbi:Lrp/AsnC family transcriptional regulator [Psychroflexus planctonicus]|uniref:AsnC family transcriptional regulator n=1 Tax=Psychroflexus planctonicus TaxID=1526575 RepID=A0ABQ1SFI3_9FLAO|nr:Lrp/AsnC family transcriptional regulator [Psychroflexus planctonicus]GGE30386.1 AsnC family transcriptional regulator [Psychroflexus planctonicus]